MTPQEIQAALEAIIYAADEPATLDQLAKALAIEKPDAHAALDQLVATYASEAAASRFATSPVARSSTPSRSTTT